MILNRISNCIKFLYEDILVLKVSGCNGLLKGLILEYVYSLLHPLYLSVGITLKYARWCYLVSLLAAKVLTMGWRNRRVASTSMNRESSRSHAVFTITVDSMEKNSEVVNIRSSQLNLVDLAGSERQKDTHTEGVRLKVGATYL